MNGFFKQLVFVSFLACTLCFAAGKAQAAFEPLDSSNPTCRDALEIDVRETRQVNGLLSNLVNRSTYFAVFSVALDKQCPFWEENAQCVIRECSVCHCADNEIPPAWLRDNSSQGDCRDGQACTKPTNELNNVDRSLTGLAALVGHPIWNTADSDRWTVRDDDAEMMYVDLRKNPEQYTGYAGAPSRRIWQAVYDENCFLFSTKCRSGICDPDTCKEERVLYRLISGLHASISMHIGRRYLLGNRWGVNASIYEERLKKYPERIDNLRLAYAVVLRALSKASVALHPSSYDYVTGNHENDQFTKGEMNKLLQLDILQPSCEDKVFDESDMFLQSSQYMLPEFRNAFRNISMIMDCVGCEKCRLWGKLQFLGLGTALRILFEDETPELERNELIALINLLHKLSTSVLWVDKMEDILARDARIRAKGGSLIAALVIVLLAVSLRPRGAKGPSRSSSKQPNSTHASVKNEQSNVESAKTGSDPSGNPSVKCQDSTEKVPNGEAESSNSASEGLRERRRAKPE